MFGDEERELLENADARAAIKLARALLDKSLHPACPAGRPAPHAISRPRCEAHTLPTKIDFLACVNAPDAQTGLFLTHRKKQDPSIWRRDQSSCFSPLPRLFLSVTPLAFICRQVSHSLSSMHTCLFVHPLAPRPCPPPSCLLSLSLHCLPLFSPSPPGMSARPRVYAQPCSRGCCLSYDMCCVCVCVCVCVRACARDGFVALSRSLCLPPSCVCVCVCVWMHTHPLTEGQAWRERNNEKPDTRPRPGA